MIVGQLTALRFHRKAKSRGGARALTLRNWPRWEKRRRFLSMGTCVLASLSIAKFVEEINQPRSSPSGLLAVFHAVRDRRDRFLTCQCRRCGAGPLHVPDVCLSKTMCLRLRYVFHVYLTASSNRAVVSDRRGLRGDIITGIYEYLLARAVLS